MLLSRHTKRREFITGIAGAAVWPLAARAQQPERMRRVGVLIAGGTENDPDIKERYSAFVRRLQQLDWTEGRNIRFETRWPVASPDRIRKDATELAALTPDVILAGGTSTLGPLLQATRNVPIVFAGVADPVGAGFVDSLAQPGGNATGFMQFEYNLSAKWLELLKQIAPNTTRAAVLRDPVVTSGIAQFAVIQSVATTLGVDVRPVNVRMPKDFERVLASFARSPNGGMIVAASGLATINRNLIISLAARYKLPTIYPRRVFVSDSGLISYGPDRIEMFRQAAAYADRILKGEKPADLPVQVPTKYQLVINNKTAKALDLTVPPSLLARADEVIE